MKYSFEVKNGNVYVSHPGLAVPIVVESWTWHCGALIQLIAERAMLRADLAAAVAERDEARTAYQVRSTEWHQHELIALALADRYKLRAEHAEARLAAIDGAIGEQMP